MLAVLDWSGHRHVHELQHLPMHCSQLGYREQQLFQVWDIQLHLLQAGQLRPWSSTGSVTTAAVTTAAIAAAVVASPLLSALATAVTTTGAHDTTRTNLIMLVVGLESPNLVQDCDLALTAVIESCPRLFLNHQPTPYYRQHTPSHDTHTHNIRSSRAGSRVLLFFPLEGKSTT
mgnify:CR=1 FL=1